jgi:hypothetical protein
MIKSLCDTSKQSDLKKMILAQLDTPPPVTDTPPPVTETPFLISTIENLLLIPVNGNTANLICDFYTPKTFNNSPPGDNKVIWNYASSSCYYSNSNASTTGGFTNGEILTNFFLFLIILGLITGFILNKVIKK